MKSIIELAREALAVDNGEDYYAYCDKEHFWGEAEDLERFADLLKAEWLKEAGEMPEQNPEWLLEYTKELAKGMAKKFYPEVPQWECLDDLAGVISQIDNMATGLIRRPESAKGAGEMPEPVYRALQSIRDGSFLAGGKPAWDKSEFADPWIGAGAAKEVGLVTLAQCQQAVAAAVARKDAEIVKLRTTIQTLHVSIQYEEAETQKDFDALTAERDALKALVNQQLTTEQVQRAKQALYEASHGDLEATDDEVKAAIGVVLPYVWP